MKILKKAAAVVSAVATAVNLSFSVSFTSDVQALTDTKGMYNDTLSYNLIDEDSDGTYDYAEIAKCISDAVSVEIPSEIENVPVTTIAEYAFRNCVYLESVIIPESVTVISDYAFAYCYKLSDVTIPDDILYNPNAFYKTLWSESSQARGEIFDIEAFNNNESVNLPSMLYPTNAGISQSQQIYNAALNGVYFINNQKIAFLSLNDGSYKTVFSSGSVTDTSEEYKKRNSITEGEYLFQFYEIKDMYCTDDMVYILGSFLWMENETSDFIYEPVVTVFNPDTMNAEKTIFPNNSGKQYSSLGVDSQERLYMAYSVDTESEQQSYYIDLLTSEGKLLSTAESQYKINDFFGFDETNGNFYYQVRYNWVYWGYDHYMGAVAAGNVSNSEVMLSELIIMTLGQEYYSLKQRGAELINGRYLCIDSPAKVSNNLMDPYSSGIFIIDSNKYDINDPSKSTGVGYEREYAHISDESGNLLFDSSGSVGTRAFPFEDNIVISYALDSFLEIDFSGKPVMSRKVDYPVFSVMNDDDTVYVIEKDQAGDFFMQKIQWKHDESMTIDNETLEMTLGSTSALSPIDDETTVDFYSWSSSASDIVSVNSNGELYAWKVGEAVVSVENAYGIVASCLVKVSAADIKPSTLTHLKGEESNNVSENSYGSYSSPVRSYINENPDSSITRLEYINGNVVVENYSDGEKLSTKKISAELELFGGAFFGAGYNFLVFGQMNPDESDSKEIMRIVKYSSDWTPVDSVSVYGANTYIPFDAGSLRMTEAAGKLYIHTCHEMYKSDDGYNHQANMTFVVDQKDMTVTDSYYDVMNISMGYASHSFNQFIQTDGEYVYRVDHGDAYPRGISITACRADDSITNVSYIIPVKFSGEIGWNFTGANVGGFELGKNNCLIAYSTLDQENDDSRQYNIKLAVADKQLNGSEIINITDYSENANISVGTPQLVKFSDSAFLIMWEEYKNDVKTVKLVTVNESGEIISDIKSSAVLNLSDCQPTACSDGLIRWYVTDNSAPVLYAVNPLMLDELFSAQGSDYQVGDANLDGKIDVRDCAFIASALASAVADGLPQTADFNGDRDINVRDAAALAKHLASR